MRIAKRLEHKIRSRVLGQSELDLVIAPEVIDDEFSEVIRSVAAGPDVSSALEIGSSSGEGSTANIVAAMEDKTDKNLYCLELSRPRFAKLEQRYADRAWVHCLNLPSVPVSAMPDDDDLSAFLTEYPDQWPLKEMSRWLKQDVEYMQAVGAEVDGIAEAKAQSGLDVFDLVLIDGSEFSGFEELRSTWGARYVLLDDIRTFKNRKSYERLADSDEYDLIAESWPCRNGFAAFALRSR